MVLPADAGVVARSHVPGPQGVGVTEEFAELEVGVAADAGVGGSATGVLGAAMPDYVPELRWYLRAVNPTYSVEPLNPVILNQWAGVVTTEAMPPQETDAPDSQVITYSFVTRAMEAAGEEIIAIVTTEFARAEHPVEEDSSPFLDPL